TRYGISSPMIGLRKRSSSRKPCSGSDAATGVPRRTGAGVAVGVTLRTLVVGTGTGVAVAGATGRGVSNWTGTYFVGVGGAAGGASVEHAVPRARRPTDTSAPRTASILR